jgi:poly(3-hydroxybutyrate) depolymerase
MFRALGPDLHVMAVCQPAVPVMAAIARMEGRGRPVHAPLHDPDGRPDRHPPLAHAVNQLAQERGVDWFKRHCIVTGAVLLPGLLSQRLSGLPAALGFMAMNMDRHMTAHWDMYRHLVKGDGDSAEKHREFYDEYLAVMDLTAEYYLQTIETVFVRHQLPKTR